MAAAMAITQVWETMVEHVTKDGATLESLEDMLHLAGSSRTFADAYIKVVDEIIHLPNGSVAALYNIGWADGCFVIPRVDQFKKLRALALWMDLWKTKARRTRMQRQLSFDRVVPSHLPVDQFPCELIEAFRVGSLTRQDMEAYTLGQRIWTDQYVFTPATVTRVDRRLESHSRQATTHFSPATFTFRHSTQEDQRTGNATVHPFELEPRPWHLLEEEKQRFALRLERCADRGCFCMWRDQSPTSSSASTGSSSSSASSYLPLARLAAEANSITVPSLAAEANSALPPP